MRRSFLVRTSASVGPVTILLMEPCSDEAASKMERDFGVVVHRVATKKPTGRALSAAARRWASSTRGLIRDLEARERFDFVLVENLEDCRFVVKTVHSRIGVDMDDMESAGIIQNLRLLWTKNLAVGTSTHLAGLPSTLRRVLIPLRRSPKVLRHSARLLVRWVRLHQLQRWAVNHADLVLVASESDRQMLGCRRNVSVVPNGFDLPKEQRPVTTRRSNRIAFWGTMSYWPNGDGAKWLVRDVLPELRTLGVSASVQIIGVGGPELGLPPQPGLEVIGFVEDLTSVLSEVDIALVPLRMGMGTRIKILEAWANGIPVVSTTIGAYGLDATDGHDLMIGDDPRSFSRAVQLLLLDPELATTVVRNGRRRAQSMTWDRSAQSLRAALQEHGVTMAEYGERS